VLAMMNEKIMMMVMMMMMMLMIVKRVMIMMMMVQVSNDSSLRHIQDCTASRLGFIMPFPLVPPFRPFWIAFVLLRIIYRSPGDLIIIRYTICVFLKSVYIRNEQNVTDLHRLF
jgi:hypothetical protein